jgi:hypothetical protein
MNRRVAAVSLCQAARRAGNASIPVISLSIIWPMTFCRRQSRNSTSRTRNVAFRELVEGVEHMAAKANRTLDPQGRVSAVLRPSLSGVRRRFFGILSA